jgi:hypothetical protein
MVWLRQMGWRVYKVQLLGNLGEECIHVFIDSDGIVLHDPVASLEPDATTAVTTRRECVRPLLIVKHEVFPSSVAERDGELGKGGWCMWLLLQWW